MSGELSLCWLDDQVREVKVYPKSYLADRNIVLRSGSKLVEN